MNYDDKIQAGIRRIQVASHIAERHGEPMTVCFSGGKDSQVMLHLVERAGVPFRAAGPPLLQQLRPPASRH